ncbi:hypothetical protein QQF64_027964 [Cirrhinus molitorella]|uniref:Uncharacterized protein n=1 Tax=Cirrhinus molitorella TaxID=172907 RepID=A0ABR3NDU9_9TELE
MKKLNVEDATIAGSSAHCPSCWLGRLAAVSDTKGHFNEEIYSRRTTKDLDVSKPGSVDEDRPVFGQPSLKNG